MVALGVAQTVAAAKALVAVVMAVTTARADLAAAPMAMAEHTERWDSGVGLGG